ncbi:type IV pilus secretin PilQ [Thauera sp. 63]|uniref:type IV pilus secretin PilQ n=1 Tax=Thauera sp. 63 TaxID=497321 RepID=UPI0002D02F87|nr:type IV pilus secretin PilQ [Thauera sp. 63]ENO79443.1 type 4 fimbrial biogenesis protein [Thauera sp. 63]
MKHRIGMLLLAAACAGIAPAPTVLAQDAAQVQAFANQIEGFEVAEQGGTLYVRLTMKEPLSAPPPSFSVANPARIAFDFPATGNALGRTTQTIEQGDLRSANIVQAGDRTRVVLNMVKMNPHDVRIDGRSVVIAIRPASVQEMQGSVVAQAQGNFAESRSTAAVGQGVRDVNFRRGKDGEGRVVVDLGSPDTGIDIRQQGGNIVVDFLGASLPEHLRRRSDVTDFGTPVTSMSAQQMGDKVRLTVTPNGLWEHNAYQSDNRFVLEVKRVVEDPNKLVQGTRGQYQGEKLSLNFQNIDVRSVLQVIADFTNFNIITSDSVQGSLTLRLKDVPWDQALDIILQAKGLDMRKNGNVIWIAPGDELAAREKLQLEAKQQINDLEPLATESFQINYHKAKEIFDFLKSKDQTILSKRGSVVVDERSNKVFVTDVASRLQSLRRLVQEIDIAPRQVLIEARIVEANKTFGRDLGVRLGYGDRSTRKLGGGGRLGFGSSEFTAANPIEINRPGMKPQSEFGRNVGESVTSGSGSLQSAFGALNLTLFNSSLTRFLNLEVLAQEVDGKIRLVSSPRVLTANQVEALIEQGTEIPYQEASSSGATSTSFKKAVLSLKVKPQITPDGRLQLSIEVNKDSRGEDTSAGPAIDTKKVKSEVLIENGGTVVIGGIYEETDTSTTEQVPLLGDIPVLGHLFKTNMKNSERREMLVFITPRIVADALTLR